jgi:membrane protein
MVLFGYQVGPLLKKTGQEILADNVSALAAQTAYYFFFSLFPLFLFLAPLLSLVVDPETLLRFVMTRIGSVMPTEGVAPLKAVLENVIFTNNAPGLMSIGALLAAWSGSNIFGALMTALNTAYDVDESRAWWKRQALRLGMLVVGTALLLIGTVVMLGGEDIAHALGSAIGLGPRTIAVWNLLQFPLAFAFLVSFAFLTYWLLPNVRQRKSHILLAALVTSVLLLVATLLFRLYVQRFPPNPTYGVVGGVLILLGWMYYTMFALLAGGELASELAHGTGAVTPPKGATYFGRIVSGDHPGTPSTAA